MEFLEREVPVKDGLLQQFIEPFEDYNNEYLVNWTESFVTLERVINRKSYLAKKLDNYEKYCTLPQWTKWCTTVPIRSSLQKNMFTSITNIMSEVAKTHY